MLAVYHVDRLAVAGCELKRGAESGRLIHAEDGVTEGHLLAGHRCRHAGGDDRVAAAARRARHDVCPVRGRHEPVCAVPEGDGYRSAVLEAGDGHRAAEGDSRPRQDAGYGIPYSSIAAAYDALALATTVRNDCK